MHPNFERAQCAATKLLLQQNFESLFIDVRKFKFDRPIIIDSFQHYAKMTRKHVSDFMCDEQSGCCVLKLSNGINLILYDDYEDCEERKHWGIVHEVGHIYLDHNCDDPTEEIEAHFFSAQIVMPEIAIYYAYKCQSGPISALDIYQNFNVSRESAQKRINTLNKKGYISFSKEDFGILKKLKPFIEDCFIPMYRRKALLPF